VMGILDDVKPMVKKFLRTQAAIAASSGDR
jgi:hypothetical protein